MSKMSELHAEQQQAERLTDVTRPPTFEQSARAGTAAHTAGFSFASRFEHDALTRIANETDTHGGAAFPIFMSDNMKRWERKGWVKIEAKTKLGETIAVITAAGRAAIAAAKGGA